MKNTIIILTLIFMLYVKSYGNVVVVGEWYLNQNHTLPLKASNYPDYKSVNPQSDLSVVDFDATRIRFFGQKPTETISNFVKSADIPENKFAVNMWILNHVDQTIGLNIHAADEDNSWTIGFWGRSCYFELNQNGKKVSTSYNMQREDTFKNYFVYLTAIHNGTHLIIQINGNEVARTRTNTNFELSSESRIVINGYFNNEPFMQISDALKYLRILNGVPNTEQNSFQFELLKNMVELGHLHPTEFHFIAGPYLNNVTKASVDIIFETNRFAWFIIEYGETVELGNSKELTNDPTDKISQEDLIVKVTLDDLKTATQYFYRINAVDTYGNKINSGILTFATAIENNTPFTFCAIADTEARVHINDRISKLIWDERPNLVINCGDITDGGKKHQKFEWNYEYFQGMTQLHSRIPVITVPGNGESDLYWYNRYHSFPVDNDFYVYKYGNAEFFMMNSNKKDEFASGGRQYNLLDSALTKSTAKWKFVCMHHAPFSSDEDDYGDSWKGKSNLGDLEIRKITPVFDKHNVDIVFFGHLHTYERTHPISAGKPATNGVTYLQIGGAGGNLEDFVPVRSPFTAKTYRGHHYVKIDINGSILDIFTYGVDGILRDYNRIIK